MHTFPRDRIKPPGGGFFLSARPMTENKSYYFRTMLIGLRDPLGKVCMMDLISI